MSCLLLSRTVTLRGLFGLAVLFALVSCQGENSSRRGSPPGAAGVAPPAPAPEMAAHGMFFAGKIEVEVLLGRGGFEMRDAARGDARPGGRGEGRGRGGFSMGGGGGGRRGGGGGGRPQGGSDGSESSASRGPGARNDDGTPAIHIVASNLPPVRLHLRLTNHGEQPADIEIPDFNSELGNFVVQPPKMLLLPNQSNEADPMTSTLGVKSDEIPLTVAIRSNGKLEKQVLTLRIVPPATTAPATPLEPTPRAGP